MLQLYPRSGAVHLLNAIDRPLLLVEGNAGPWTQTPFKKYVCFSFSFWNVAGQPEGAGGTLPVAGDCHPSDSAGAEALHGAAAPALPVAAVDLRPAGLLAEKNNSLHFFFRNIAGQAEGAGGTLSVPGDDPSDPAGPNGDVPHVPALRRAAAAPAIPAAAVVLRAAGLPRGGKGPPDETPLWG